MCGGLGGVGELLSFVLFCSGFGLWLGRWLGRWLVGSSVWVWRFVRSFLSILPSRFRSGFGFVSAFLLAFSRDRAIVLAFRRVIGYWVTLVDWFCFWVLWGRDRVLPRVWLQL